MKFKSRVLFHKAVRDFVNTSFCPVWSDHPKVAERPMEPELWAKTDQFDRGIIAWVLEPDGSRVAAIRYQEMNAPLQLLRTLKKHRKQSEEKGK